jgi:hypothetical protein
VASARPAGRGGPGGADAGRAFVSVSVSPASVLSPVSGAGVQHHAWLSTRALSSVRCGPLSVQVSGVRCPAQASAVPGREVVEGWRWAGSRMAGMAGVGVVACPVHGQFVGCPGRTWRSRLRRSAGSAEGSAWTWPSSWEVVEVVARSTAWATRIGWMGAGIARWWRARVRSEVATTLCGHRVRPRAGSPGRCEPPGLGCDLRVRPWCGRSMQ